MRVCRVDLHLSRKYKHQEGGFRKYRIEMCRMSVVLKPSLKAKVFLSALIENIGCCGNLNGKIYGIAVLIGRCGQ